jgi:hypothetical protein
MKRSVFAIFAALALLGTTKSAFAEGPTDIDPSIFWNQYHDLEAPVVAQIHDPDADAFLANGSWIDECQSEGGVSPKGVLEDLNDIVAFGEKLWKLVEAGRPVVSFRTPLVHALPSNIRCWADLVGWHAPKSSLWEIRYRNGFGAEVVKFRYRLVYSYGGGQDGQGRYLANVTVVPAELNVAWGFKFDAEVNVGRAINTGTRQNPLAGLQIQVRWNIKSVVKEGIQTENYFVQGDGSLQRLQ